MEQFDKKHWILLWAIPVLFFVAVAGFKSVKLPVAPVANAVVEKVPQRSMFAEGVTGSMAYLPIRHKLSGAGDSVVNQTFEKDNSTPGLIQFAGADNADCKIELTVDSEWVISYLGTDLYMVPASSAEEIPASGWVVLPGGASPAPTVEVVIDYTASGAGSVNCNGSYYEIENEWGAGRLFVNENDYAIHIPDAGSYTFMGYPPDLIVENPDEANYRVNSLDPASSGWELTDGINPGLAPAPTVTAVSAPITDATAPTFDSASINADGDQLTVNWTETESAPVTGNTGLSISGLSHGPATLSNVTTTGTTTTADISRVITDDETPQLDYVPGNFKDSADTPNSVAAFSGQAITNNSTQEHEAMPITFTIETGVNKPLAKPTTTDPDVTITQTQQGSDGTLSIPARIPMLNKNFTVRMANDVDSLDAATPLNKAMMNNCDLSALVNPIWFFDENEETFLSHVDGEEPQRTIGLRVSQSSSDLPALQAQRTAQPATPKWYQLRGVHADDSAYSFKTEYFAAPSAAVTLGAGNNVRYVEFPMATVISGKGFAMRFRVTEPA